MIFAGIGCRKDVTRDEVLAAIGAAMEAHGLSAGDLSALATTAFKKDEAAIFTAGNALGLDVIVVDPALAPSPSRVRLDTSPPEGGEEGHSSSSPSRKEEEHLSSPPSGGEVVRRTGEGDGNRAWKTYPLQKVTLSHSALSFAVAGTPSVSESAALAAAGAGARLLGPRIALGRVTCALATSEAAR